MTRRFLALLLLAGLSGPLAGQENTERIVNERDSRSHDYDLLHQRIELGDFDWDSLGFRGRVTTTLRALRSGFDSVVLDAGGLLDIRSVAASNGKTALRWEHVRDSLIVYLERDRTLGDTVRFTVEYQGRVQNGRGLTFIAADSLPPARPRQLWSQGEAMDNHLWFPTYDFPNDKATWEMVVTVPAGYTAVSNGALVSDRTGRNGNRTMTWRQGQPASTYLASIIVAPLVRLTDRWRGRPLEYYVYREDSARARALFDVTPDMIEVFSALTGVDYPWPRYAQTTVADFFGGMENVGATTLVDWIPTRAAYADRPWYRHILIPHELAHQWFGDYVTTANWANMWLNEGFAEFMPGQYWGRRLGRHAMEEYYVDEYEQFMRIDARRRMPLASLGSNNIYPKGALVLRMLQQHLGEERFWLGVRRYLTDHALDVATSDDLRQAFRAATGENLDWFWEQWVYRAGYPQLKVSAEWDSVSAILSLQVEQTQRDTLPVDRSGTRFSVPEAFRLPLSIRVGTAGGDVRQEVWLEQRQQLVRIAGVTGRPTMVILDEDNAVLKELTFDQPVDWLATQLRNDPNLWNRDWVIGQLARRRESPEAAAALAAAATGADYFHTRAQAALALSGVAGEAASGALLTALGDTSAQVRAAAAQAMGERGDAGAVPALRRRWEADSSETVRAQALLALGRLSREEAGALIVEGLASTSYLDVIAEAATQAVIERGDSTLLAELDRAAGRVRLAMVALGVFGARGHGEALDLLDRHLLSSRATIRHRALEVYRNVVPDSIARTRLLAIRPAVSDEATRREIDELLARSGQ
jgi:aminopeptidase N